MSSGSGRYAEQASYQLWHPNAPSLLLLLHGLGGDRNQPLRLTADLNRNDLVVLAPDARAHGDTPLIGEPDDFTLDAMADDVVALLDRLGQLGKPTYIAGISMGAAVALRLALRPLRGLFGVAFIRPAFSDQPNPANLEPLRRIADLLPLGAAGREQFTHSREYRSVLAVSPSGAASLLDQFDKPAARERSIRLACIPGNVAWRTPNLSDVTVPTLVLGAPRDPVHPAVLAERWAALLPHAVYHQLPTRDDDPELHETATRTLVHQHLAASQQIDGSQQPGGGRSVDLSWQS